jgi:hypothetical protein
LGQQPYVTEEFRGGRTVLRLTDIGQVLDLLGVRGKCEPYSVMAPQWNLRFPDEAGLRAADQALTEAYVGRPEQQLFAHTVAGNTISINVRQKLPRPIDWDAECVFPTTGRRVRMRELCAEKDPTPKQGYHDPAGVLIVSGPGVRPGVEIEDCTTLDLAPTMLRLLGLPVPDHMTGRVLEELLERKHAVDSSPAVSGKAQAVAAAVG